jgi:hypothetical protein
MQNAKMVHFAGSENKPWVTRFNNETIQLRWEAEIKAVNELLSKDGLK